MSNKKFKEYLSDTAPILRRAVDDPLPPIMRTRIEKKGFSSHCVLFYFASGDRPTIEELEMIGDTDYANIPTDQLLSLPTTRGSCRVSP